MVANCPTMQVGKLNLTSIIKYYSVQLICYDVSNKGVNVNFIRKKWDNVECKELS